MIVGIVGLGLIGGSLAKSLKLNTKHTVYGYDISEAEMQKANLFGAIDAQLSQQNLNECNMVIVALYPRDTIEYIKNNAHIFKDGAVVIDCAGVKGVVCKELSDISRGKNWSFIGGHPMAGREYSGFKYSKDDLFENASMILTPYSDTAIETVEDAKEFFLDAGFRRVVFSTPDKHDEMIAYTSQMAHIISSTYVRSELALKHKGFSAGSFQDMTRVARLNENMWSELFMLNKEPLLDELDGMIKRLIEFKELLAHGEEENIKQILREGCIRKDSLQ